MAVLPFSFRLQSSQGRAPAGIFKTPHGDLLTGTTGFLGSVGPTLAVLKTGWIVWVDLGISPAFLSHDRYGDENLSGHIQFLTHAGVSLFPIRNLSIGYEYQHVSNADIQQPNPGLNMHNIEISYRIW